MRNASDIIAEAEKTYGIELDPNFDTDDAGHGLCDGEYCRHSECDCWTRFERAVEEQLQQQIVDACSYCQREKAERRGTSPMPNHFASPNCESGKRDHCTCDTCY